jgi:malonyl-CoA O-methyltransferase
MVNKELIRRRFEKNLSTYTENAVVQKHMASELLASLIINCGKNFNKILEIGCGTGTLTKEILNQLEFEELFVNDIVENSLDLQCLLEKYPPRNQRFRPSAREGNKRDNRFRVTEIYGDCEKISFPQNLDLVISNATFQWLENLPAILDKIHSSLNSNGILAFSIFEEGNLQQIKTLTGKTLNYYKKSDLEKILSQNFKIIYSNSETVEIEFNNAQDVLKHLKLTGVNSLSTSNWTKTDLNGFSEKYKNLFSNDKGKLVLTYKPVWFICAKI